MIDRIIRWSLENRVLVLVLASMLAVSGIQAWRSTPVDAIPDLSDVQVIVRTAYAGQAPRVVEDQVTYPLTSALLSVPGAQTVRGYSFFGDSFVYVIFEDGTDLYWARSRVLEQLQQAANRLPEGARPVLGPDATGVGWIYEYALVDRSGRNDLGELRALQDWFLKFELQAVPGVAEVASVGGMVRQYQVVLDPDALWAQRLTIAEVRDALVRGNHEAGGSVIEVAEAEIMVRAGGYLDSVKALEAIPLKVGEAGYPVLLGDVAEIRLGAQMRRGIAELDGEGEVVGGIVIMRSGENARRTIERVKARLEELRSGLPEGVEIVETYDRSALIDRAVDTLEEKLLQEIAIVVLVCLLFLFHFRSSLVIAVSLPLGVLSAILIMRAQGINANIMSLGGIAIAIGAMVDAAIVMIENLHRRLEESGRNGTGDRWRAVAEAAGEVGGSLFISLLIITVSFLPVFSLEAQEGRLFAPLAWTKTWAMASAALLSVTLVPALLGYFVRGRILPEASNPLNRTLRWLFAGPVRSALRFPWLTLALALLLAISGIWPLRQLGTEFMPDLNEGDLMYMPSTLPGISVGKAGELLQQTDKLIRSVPEVAQVFGKAGRADTATDPAPLSMIETVVRLKPASEWRPGVTLEDIRRELDARVQLPGLTNAWVWPIQTRIDMLATGIRTPVGIKIAGPDLGEIERIGRRIERLLGPLPGVVSVYAERSTGGRYLILEPDRVQAARFGLAIADIHDTVRFGIGGLDVTETVEGLERYPVNLRYPRAWRDSPQRLENLPIVTQAGQRVTLGEVAELRLEDGPPVIRSENARPNGWVLIDVADRDLGAFVSEARKLLAEQLVLPPGYSLSWSGEYEYLERARQRLGLVIPLTLGLILLLLLLHFRRLAPVLVILGSLPLALVGGVWLLYWLDFRLSVAVGVGFIALAGIAVEIGVVLWLYLDQAWARQFGADGAPAPSPDAALRAVAEGTLLRLRPILMTVATIVLGLAPIMLGQGTGAEIMQRIAAPLVGGMLSATVLTLLVVPAAYLLLRRRESGQQAPPSN